jgi:hypothetical protein
MQEKCDFALESRHRTVGVEPPLAGLPLSTETARPRGLVLHPNGVSSVESVAPKSRLLRQLVDGVAGE